MALFPVLVVGQIKATGFTSIGGVDTTVLSLAFLLCVTVAVFVKHPRYPIRQLVPYFLLALVVLLGVARSDVGEYQSLKTRDFFLLTGVISLCIPVLLRDLRDVRGLLAVWFFGGALVATTVLIVGGADDLYGRAGIGEATHGPAYLSAALVVVGSAALGERLMPLAVALPGVLIGGIALVGIGSRGPIIATAVGFLVWIMLRGAFRARTLLVTAVVVSVAAIGVNQASDAALSRFVLEDPVRRGLWTTARRAFFDSPILGQGWGDFANLAPLDRYPHNLGLELASELGLLGLIAMAYVLISATRRAWRYRAQAEFRILAALAVVMLTGQQFSSDLTNRQLWIALIPCLLLPVIRTDGNTKTHQGVGPIASTPDVAVPPLRPAAGRDAAHRQPNQPSR